jgi:hypothetical protein
VMGESHAAAGIAMARKLGAHRALWITTLSCALLTYGGVVVWYLERRRLPARLTASISWRGPAITFPILKRRVAAILADLWRGRGDADHYRADPQGSL